jgi:hypothetical protein
MRYLTEPVGIPRLLAWGMQLAAAIVICAGCFTWIALHRYVVPAEAAFTQAQADKVRELYPDGEFRAGAYVVCIQRIRWYFSAAGDQYHLGEGCWR